MSSAPFFPLATSPPPGGAGLISPIVFLFGMFLVAQFSLLGIWLGRYHYSWWQVALEFLGALLLLPLGFMGYMVVGLMTLSEAFALLVMSVPGHLLGSFLGMRALRLYGLNITRELSSSVRNFQFSMWGMFLLITALAVVLGIDVWAARQVGDISFFFLFAALYIVGPPALLAPLTVCAALSIRFPYPRSAIALAVALSIALTIAFAMTRRDRHDCTLLLGGEFLIVAAELLALRANSLRLSRSRGSTSSE
jgi:hypothetical protein